MNAAATTFISSLPSQFLQTRASPFRHPAVRPARTCSRRPQKPLITCCEERPHWKTRLVDVDFAKDEQLEILEESLDTALATEQFRDAADIRDKLLRLQSGALVAVLSANMKFYHAFNARSIVDMASCWMQAPDPLCKHAAGPLVKGYVNIINSYGYFFSESLPDVTVRNCRVIMRGTIGYVTCDEVFLDEDGKELVMCGTNIFMKHNGQWYLYHHSSMMVTGELAGRSPTS